MDGGQHLDVLSRHTPPPRWRLTTVDYHRMGEAGILPEDSRVELIEGQLVAVSSIGPRHAMAVDWLAQAFVFATRGLATVRVRNPVVLDGYTEPNPDIVLARPRWRGYPTQHPEPDGILLLVEVADSSIVTDKGAKCELYARAAITEYWVVDLTCDVVIVHRDPRDGGYASIVTHQPSETLDVAALPDVAIPAEPLFT